MNLAKSFSIFLLIINSINFLFNKVVLSQEQKFFSIISDIQSQNKSGNYETSDNVIIKNESNFSASSEKLIFEKQDSKIHLKGNVNIKNYKLGNVLVENLETD